MVLNSVEKGKKAVIFTLVSILISSVVLATFFLSQSAPLDSSVVTTQIRIDTVNNYINNLENYMSSQIGANARVAIKNMIDLMIVEDSYFSNTFESELKNCLKSGSVTRPGVGVIEEPCGSNIITTLSEIDLLAEEELNINSTMTLDSISVKQNEPWKITVNMIVNISIIDGYAEWKTQKNFSGNASILGLRDPTYEVNVSGVFAPKDLRTNTIKTRDPWNGWVRYPATLNLIAISDEYFQYGYGPNFLNRLNGNLNAQDLKTGIASLIIPNGTLPTDYDVSNLDFTYWRWEKCVDVPHHKYNFFYNLNAEERARLNISENETSINGTIIPDKLLDWTNINETTYYEDSVGC